MKILGISGIEDAALFKKSEWHDLDDRESRIVQGHDAAAALLVDGDIVAAAAEERFNRLKHSGRFPINAIQYCLATAKLSIKDIDELAHAFDYEPWKVAFERDAYSR